jgi:hypothetical protein
MRDNQASGKTVIACGRLYRGVMIVNTMDGAYIQRESDYQPIHFLDEAEAKAFVDAFYLGGARVLNMPTVYGAVC